MSKSGKITTELTNARFARALKKFVGKKNRPYTCDAFIQAVGVQRRTLDSWLREERKPEFHKVLAVMSVLGPEFADEVLELAGLNGTKRIDGFDDNAFVLNKNLGHAVAAMSDALADDGKVDHLEKQQMLPIMRELSAQLSGWITAIDGIEKQAK